MGFDFCCSILDMISVMYPQSSALLQLILEHSQHTNTELQPVAVSPASHSLPEVAELCVCCLLPVPRGHSGALGSGGPVVNTLRGRACGVGAEGPFPHLSSPGIGGLYVSTPSFLLVNLPKPSGIQPSPVVLSHLCGPALSASSRK